MNLAIDRAMSFCSRLGADAPILPALMADARSSALSASMIGERLIVRYITVHSDVKERPPLSEAQGRTARIEARIAPDLLAIVKRAAEIQGRSVSDFVVSAAREAASRTIEETQIIRLSVTDQRAFAEAIVHPPPPSLSLARAAAAYRRLIKTSA